MASADRGHRTVLGPRVVFRADASPLIGGGHVMRCLTLARALARGGAEILLLIGAETAATVPSLASSPFLTREADAEPGRWPAQIREVWPGGADLAVVDHYALGAEAERLLRGAAGLVMAIDDLADRAHDCDLLLDQTYGRTREAYEGLVPAHARVLAGSTYALLRPELAALRPSALARRASEGEVTRILIALGLGDVVGPTAIAVRAASAVRGDATIDVVLGPSASDPEPIRALARSRRSVRLHIDPPDLHELMMAADLAIGAAGSMSWERCALGLPTVMLVLAENQKEAANSLSVAGAAVLAAGTEAAIAHAVAGLADDARGRAVMSLAASRIADGLGAARVTAATMEETRRRAA